MKRKGVIILTIVSLMAVLVGIFALDSSFAIAENAPRTGMGTADEPYIIESENDIIYMREFLSAYYKISENFAESEGISVNLSKKELIFNAPYVPIGTIDAPFTGGFDGNGWKIIISSIVKCSDGGFFGATENATVSNFSLNLTCKDEKEVINNLGGVVGTASGENSVFQNIEVECDIEIRSNNLGGIVGVSQPTVRFENCSTSGKIVNLYDKNAGGISGTGGAFKACFSACSLFGGICVGGLLGGHDIDASFEDSFFSGDVGIRGDHKNNYPYCGVVNGYGAWVNLTLVNSGQTITVTYDDADEVDSVELFNTEKGAERLSKIENDDNTITETYKVVFEKTTADEKLFDETLINGVTGNYGGIVIRFTMKNGLYKYVSTLDRSTTKIQSNISVELGRLTSYQDNFSKIKIDKKIGTSVYSTKDGYGIYGSAEIGNANDFEHLAWRVNGGIPTVFASDDGACAYNQRTIATISVKLTDNVDLDADRVDERGVLNRKDGKADGEKLTGFYGFGTSEMNPYRGSINGGGYRLNVKMNFPDAYLVGIIAISSEYNFKIKIENIEISGEIIGKYRVGIVGMFDGYMRSGVLSLNRVVSGATIKADNYAGGLVGYNQDGAIMVENCKVDVKLPGIGTNSSVGGSGCVQVSCTAKTGGESILSVITTLLFLMSAAKIIRRKAN